jgi:putative endonuclease
VTRDRLRCGSEGEDLAAAFLQARGHVILARNYRCSRGEIDLVTRAGDTLVFCEVRTRRSDGTGSSLESVTPRKQRRIVRVAAVYLSERSARRCPLRFDVVAVEMRGRTVRIEHVPDAFGGA